MSTHTPQSCLSTAYFLHTFYNSLTILPALSVMLWVYENIRYLSVAGHRHSSVGL
jgi:hypothetical protein